MPTISLTNRFQYSNDIQSEAIDLTDDNLLTIDDVVAASGTNTPACVFPYATLKAVYVSVDQDSTVTFSGSSNPTFTLLANTSYVWYSGSHITNPFVANVATLTVVNGSSTTACNVACRVLFH